MQTRQLGKEELKVPAMGLGCMTMTAIYGPADDERSIATIHRAIERGAGFLDTSDMVSTFSTRPTFTAADTASGS